MLRLVTMCKIQIDKSSIHPALNALKKRKQLACKHIGGIISSTKSDRNVIIKRVTKTKKNRKCATKEYRKPHKNTEVLLSLHQLLVIRTVPSLQHLILRTLQSLAQLLRLLPFSTHSLHPYSGLNRGNGRLQLLSWTPGLSTITRLDTHFGNHAKIGIVAVQVQVSQGTNV